MTEKRESEVDSKSRKEMLDEMFISAHGYLNRALPEIEKLAEGFYQSPSDETWQSFLQLLEGIQWLFDFMNHVVQNKSLFGNWVKFAEISTNLQEQLHQLEEAVQSQDMTLIGDTILFEVAGILETARSEILYTIDKEDMKHDLN
ncbi:MAG: hypothetical protein AAGU27_05800 [Dehalobacterium sp.]